MASDDPVLELTMAIRSLSQSLELMHQDLRQVIQAGDRTRIEGLDRVCDRLTDRMDDISKALQDLPLDTSDRVQKTLEKSVDAALEDVRNSINELRQKLWVRAVSAGKVDPETGEALVHKPDHSPKIDDTTGSFSIDKDGGLRGYLPGSGAKKIWWIVKAILAALLAGGAGVSVVETFKKLFGIG